MDIDSASFSCFHDLAERRKEKNMSRWKAEEEWREDQERRRQNLWRKQREYDWRFETATRSFMRDGLDERSAENLVRKAMGLRP